MSAALECLCSPLCSYVCAGLSTFAIVVLLGLGSLFQKDYRFLGEDWKTEAAEANEHEVAARNCFMTAAIYGGFLGLSFLCCVTNKARGRTL
jgi:hypothetical protein